MQFKMPYGQYLEIIPSRYLTFEEELEIGHDEELDDLVWYISISEKENMPWSAKTKLQANAIALGCQFGAYWAEKTREG
jgi:hypothetical protein